MNKKVYEPGEMICLAFYPNSNFRKLDPSNKAAYVAAEKAFFNLLSQQCKEDEQTDDNPGVPLNDYSHD